MNRSVRFLVKSCALTAVVVAVHTAVNVRKVRSPAPSSPATNEQVTVLIPARDEESHIDATIHSVVTQTGVANLQVIVLDDGSHDATASAVGRWVEREPRLRVITAPDERPPHGWLGKAWACARLSDEADGTVLVFIDADVMLYPHALRAAIATLRGDEFVMVAPYPLQIAGSLLERIVQPLITWSWMATVPIRWAERSHRASLAAANGQFLVVDAAAYRAVGGHASVRAEVLDDIALMRRMKAAGRTATVDGSQLAQCRMYDTPRDLIDGYGKSLWSAFGGPVRSFAVNAGLLGVFVAPAVAALAARDRKMRRWGRVGYAAAVASRVIVSRRTGEGSVPYAFLHPISITAFTTLNVVSWLRHRSGTNRWKGRPVTVGYER